ncbi:MAG: lysophospholipase [Parcubacteria group bacterium Gr01-1014_19]|nr:MAG: lysophospholipase [Parcubacteria group bacterium Gr01-1014_19]
MFLQAKDGTKIAYDLYPAENPAGYLVLLHMMPATKGSWKELADLAARESFSSIAIDLRGHGESDGGPDGYKDFSDSDHQESILDVEAAVEFLKNQGATPEKIILVGASIGANLALWHLAEHPEIKKAALLSLGEDYRGIKAPPLIRELKPGQSLLMFASRDDVRKDGDNASSNERLAAMVPAGVGMNLVVYDSGGHGTSFLSFAKGDIIKFIKG